MGREFTDTTMLITGGTGSLGGAVLRKLVTGEYGHPEIIRIFSRDEAKQAELKKWVALQETATRIQFWIGDVRDFSRLSEAVEGCDYVIHAAAMKHVPECEQNPEEAVMTNCIGSANLVRAVKSSKKPIRVIGISTDKACAPFSLMGMTKAIMERIFVPANAWVSHEFMCVRMGNMLVSRGSVIPFFYQRVKENKPIPITHQDMTRFFITLEQAAEYIVRALWVARRGQIFVPEMKSARIMDIAYEIGGKNYPVHMIGMRSGEKIHDCLISKTESRYARECGGSVPYTDGRVWRGWLIYPSGEFDGPQLEDLVPQWEYSSSDNIMPLQEMRLMVKGVVAQMEREAL